MNDSTLGNPPPAYLPLPLTSLADMSNTPGWYDAGFRAWGLVFTPGQGAVMVAGTDSAAAVWWMLQKAAACCNLHTGFSATPADSAHYVRGVGCDIALVRHKEAHGRNRLANEALRVIGEYLGVEYYRFPIKGTMCLYMPYLSIDVDDAQALAPELVAAVAATELAHTQAARAADQAGTRPEGDDNDQ